MIRSRSTGCGGRCSGADVDAYDVGRPSYPDQVYELLRDRCGLGPGTRTLEIGPGTGQATRDLLEAGSSVTAVEFSPELADRLRAKHGSGDLEVVVDSFEDAALPVEAFDLVVAATAFHWVPPESALPRVADLLRDDGHLALWWNVYGDPDRDDPFRDALESVLADLAPELLDVPSASNPGKATSHALDTEARIAEIDASGRYGPVHHEVIPWTGRHRPDALRALFASFSPWLALAEKDRKAVLDAVEHLATEDFDGIVERPYLTPIYTATKSS